MKKLLFLSLLIFTVTLVLVSCGEKVNTTPSIDIWDGSVGTQFNGGDGSEAAPYEIVSGAQLAYLANQVNSGADLKGKYFILKNDIDLSGIEWTPIGNGEHSFEGCFGGNGKTIHNMNITVGTVYDWFYTEGRSMRAYTAGLFGSCLDAAIKNLNITNSKIEIRDTDGRLANQIQVGILCGVMQADEGNLISNIKISNADIVMNFQESTIVGVNIGGALGFANHGPSSVSTYKKIQTDISFSATDRLGPHNNIGGLFGYLKTDNICTVKDVRSDLSIKIDDAEKWYEKPNNLGAFGATQCVDKPFSITNLFSCVTIVQSCEDFFGYPIHQAHAAIGNLVYYAEKTATEPGYILENVFGYVKQIDEIKNDTQYIFTLYDLPDYFPHTEVNCQGTLTLPADNGFDPSIWDISESSSPKLK